MTAKRINKGKSGSKLEPGTKQKIDPAAGKKMSEAQLKIGQPAGSYQKPKKKFFSLPDLLDIFAPKSKNVYINDGYKLLRQENYSQAILAFQNAIQENPTSIEGFIGLAETYRGQGGIANSKLAIQSYHKVLEIDCTMLNIYDEVIKVYDRLGDMKNKRLEQKKLFVARTLKSADTDPTANNNMGVILLKQNSIDPAIIHFKKALRYKKSFNLAKSNLAKAYFQKSRAVKNKSDKKEFLILASKLADSLLANEKSPEMLLLKAKIYFRVGKTKDALELCNEAHSLDPSYKEIYATKQAIEERLGNIMKASQAHEDFEAIKEEEDRLKMEKIKEKNDIDFNLKFSK